MVDVTEEESSTDLVYQLASAAMEDPAEARRLIASHPGLLGATTSTGETALHYLAVESEAEAVRFLAAEGADVNSRSDFGDTPLLDAVTVGSVDMVRLLLELGADVRAANSQEDTTLHAWVTKGDAEILGLLLEAGADLEARDSLGRTPLGYAVDRHAYSPESRVAQSMTMPPDFQAMIDSTRAQIQGVLDACPDVDQQAFFKQDPALPLEVVRRLHGAGAHVDARDPFRGATLLMEAAGAGDLEMTTLLLELGADVNARDDSQATPLHCAADFGMAPDVVRLLIQSGADLRALDKDGHRPADVLPERASAEVRTLLQA